MLLGPDQRRFEDVDRWLRILLGESSYREAAALVADEIATMPSAADLAIDIEALADA